MTTRPKLNEVMAPYARIPEQLGPADFRPCCEKVCADSVFYTPFFAELVWRALRTVVMMPARTRADLVPEGCCPASKPSMPLWCAMVTRTISLKCKEAQEPEAKEAVAKEVAYHVERGTWDLSRVRELSDWMRYDAYTEVLLGRLFVTLVVKFAAKSEQKFRARAVYQGNNIWSRSGRSVYEIFEEVWNSPSSLTAARTAMAVCMMREMRASYRDASNAWSWFEDDASTILKYKRPAVLLVYALPGHPESGNVWGRACGINPGQVGLEKNRGLDRCVCSC